MTAMIEMGPSQRAVEAMYERVPDRVPCVPLIDNSYSAPVMGVPVSQCFPDPTSYAESLIACLERHSTIDGVSINLCLADEIILEKQEQADGYIVKTTGGTTWMVPHNDIGSVMEREIVSFDGPRLESEDPLKPGIFRTLRAVPADIRRRYLINAGVTGPFSQVCFMKGIERVMMATIDDPAGLHRAIEKRLPLALQWIEEMAELDIKRCHLRVFVGVIPAGVEFWTMLAQSNLYRLNRDAESVAFRCFLENLTRPSPVCGLSLSVQQLLQYLNGPTDAQQGLPQFGLLGLIVGQHFLARFKFLL